MAVIVVGPPSSMVGGMARVVEQVLSLDWGARYRAVFFPNTFSPGGGERSFRRFFRHVSHLRALGAAIRQNAAAVVHLHTCSGFSFFRSVMDLMLARRLGARVILHVHGAAFDEFHAQAGFVKRRIIARSLSRADRVIALSESWRQKLQHMSPRAKVAVVENAVSVPATVPSRPGEGPCHFLLLARMDVWKGIDDLLEASARLKGAGVGFKLTLAGPPGTAGDAAVLGKKLRARGLEKTVRYVGSVQGVAKETLLREADVYVQPSHHEGMPIALLEALSFGLPIVATEVGAVPEVLADRREGLLVPPHRPDRLARAMGALAKSVERRAAMGRAAFALASTRFGIDRFRQDLFELYDEVRGLDLRVAWPSEAPPCHRENMPAPASSGLGHGTLNPQTQR